MPVEIKAYQQLASFRYIRNLERYKDEKPYMIAEADHVPENKRSNIELEWHDNVPVEDVRGRESDFTIEHNSFEFVKLGSSVPFPDAGSVSAYVESVAELLRQRLQADKVICYDTTYRQDSRNRENTHDRHTNTNLNYGDPVTLVHMDQTKDGGMRRTQTLLCPNEIEEFLTGNYRTRIFNVWRPAVQIVEDQPLAFCDPRTVVPEDCLAIDRVTPTSYSEVTYLKYNAAQEWYFLKHQRMDEVAVFVSYDSEGLGQSNFCPHASFKDASASETAVARESLELRFVTFNKLYTTTENFVPED